MQLNCILHYMRMLPLLDEDYHYYRDLNRYRFYAHRHNHILRLVPLAQLD